ncbi:helix-turn-helix transcriptional regulator [Corynebacterium sp. Marseille-Q2516]
MINPDAFEFTAPAATGGAHAYVYDIGTYHFNWHDDIELLVVAGGRVELATAGATTLLGERDAALLNSNQGHATLAVEPGSRAIAVHLQPTIFAQYVPGFTPQFSSTPAFPTDQLTARLATLLLRDGDSAVDMLRTIGDVGHLAADIVECFPLSQRNSRDHRDEAAAPGPEITAALGRVCAYIEQAYTQRLTLAQLARLAGYSEPYLSSVFSQTMGMTCFEFISRVRLRAATRQLSATDALIGDIAFDNGFADTKTFTTAFKSTFGLTPSKYRANLGTTPGARQVDATFKRRFTPRSQADVYATLTSWAHSGAVTDNQDDPVVLARRLAAILSDSPTNSGNSGNANNTDTADH